MTHQGRRSGSTSECMCSVFCASANAQEKAANRARARSWGQGRAQKSSRQGPRVRPVRRGKVEADYCSSCISQDDGNTDIAFAELGGYLIAELGNGSVMIF